MKAISKDPDKRYSSALEFARALEGTLQESDRAHGGERVSGFIQGLMGTQQEAQRAALIDAIRRADRASLMPASATLEGLSTSGTSGVESVSTVGITQSLLPDRDPAFRRGAKLKLGLFLAGLGLLVGGIAFAIARKPAEQKSAAPPATSATVARPIAQPAPPVDPVSSQPVPDDSGIKVEITPPEAQDATTRQTARPRPAPASSSAPAPVRKKPSWREDPGF
jgi:hypothetical protein